MLEHRFRHLITEDPLAAPTHALAAMAFMPCPVPVVQMMSADWQARAEQLYRLALEQARIQTETIRWSEFSLN